jgi:alkylation response protein AidB-like acyl-CoA dehydrogenase
MDFTLTDEQRMFVDMFRDFAQKEVAPLAEALDRQERSPSETLAAAAGLDLLGIAFPEQFGGMNAGLLAHGLLMEELGKACLSTAVTLGAHCAAAMAVATAGSNEQKRRLLPRMIRADKIAALAVTEPDAGSDLGAVATTARLDRDAYVISGRKSHVINGDIADLIVSLVQTDSGPALIVVEKATPGFVVGWRDRQMGLRGAEGCSLFFDDCQVPVANLLADEAADSGHALRRTWQFSRLALSFACLGLAERGLADSVEFAKNRQQFGGPVAMKQTIQGYLGDMATQIETLRHLAHYTAWLMDEGKATERDIAMLKLWAGQVATWVINKTVQIHGGMGYIKSFHVERLYRDARAMTILEGTAETQRLTVAGAILKAAGLEVTL